MNYLNEKLKSLTTALLAVIFLAAVSVSCGTATKDSEAGDEAEATEQTEATEHPGGEHPAATDDMMEEADTTTVEADTTAMEVE
jgi:hypothetical protein